MRPREKRGFPQHTPKIKFPMPLNSNQSTQIKKQKTGENLLKYVDGMRPTCAHK